MSRKTVPEKEIIDWINKRLFEELCEEAKVNHVQRLRELNQNGCNWSDTVIIRNGRGCSEITARIIQEAQNIFSLE